MYTCGTNTFLDWSRLMLYIFFFKGPVCGSNKIKEDWKRSWEQILRSSSQLNCSTLSNSCLGRAEAAPLETKARRALPKLLPTEVLRTYQVWLYSVCTKPLTDFHKTLDSSPSSTLIPNFRPCSIHPDSHTKKMSVHKNVYQLPKRFPKPLTNAWAGHQ